MQEEQRIIMVTSHDFSSLSLGYLLIHCALKNKMATTFFFNNLTFFRLLVICIYILGVLNDNSKVDSTFQLLNVTKCIPNGILFLMWRCYMVVIGRLDIHKVLSALENNQAEHCSSWAQLLEMAPSGFQCCYTKTPTWGCAEHFLK